jgi:hypothetical protein
LAVAAAVETLKLVAALASSGEAEYLEAGPVWLLYRAKGFFSLRMCNKFLLLELPPLSLLLVEKAASIPVSSILAACETP